MEYKNLTEIAAEYNLKYRRLSSLREKGLIKPKKGKRLYDPEEVKQIYFSYYSNDYDETIDKAHTVALERQKAQARLYNTKAALMELELQKRKGQLIEKDDLIRHFVARILNVKFNLQSLTKSLPPLLYQSKSETEMENIIRNEVHKILSRFAAPLPKQLGDINIDLDKLESKLAEVIPECLIETSSSGNQKN